MREGFGRTESAIQAEIRRKHTLIAGLIDPDEFTPSKAAEVSIQSQKAGVSLVLIGGSTVADNDHLDDIVITVKKSVTIPVILFPGNITGVSQYADAILFSSLLNSSNPYFIVGAQSIGAIKIFKSHMEAIPMAYLVFGSDSTTAFIGQVRSIPIDNPSVTIMYSLAARYMGMRALYLEAGSGSSVTVPTKIVIAARKYFPGLLIVGGGIRKPKSATDLARSGADILVVGNLLERRTYRRSLRELVTAVRKGH